MASTTMWAGATMRRTTFCASRAISLRSSSTSTRQEAAQRRRLKFSAAEPLTFRESISVVQRREARKEEQRALAMNEATAAVSPFGQRVAEIERAPLRRAMPTVLQINIGKLCNLTCRHCHVESGPSKRRENMDLRTVERCIELLRRSPSIEVVDITGGAPELNLHFRHLVKAARSLGKQVIDRCNLVVLFEKGQEDLVEFLADQQVHVVASLPCYTEETTDKQRGKRVHQDSVEAIRLLNDVGYGKEGTGLQLDLVYNPSGASLPPSQASLEEEYRNQLHTNQGITFNSLFAITNMPIKRFADDLFQSGKLSEYFQLLAKTFNPSTLSGLMCRETINVQWDGKLFDCDFNAALDMPMNSERADIWTLDSLDVLAQQPIKTAKHCYGCTAGTGSSCGGSLAEA
ncbi:hypothetical protein CBS101457_005576 [Exobasidium rhododendri]|nr:hypothetical protein CBS101457_005576 [Exobasidium rhododendri]